MAYLDHSLLERQLAPRSCSTGDSIAIDFSGGLGTWSALARAVEGVEKLLAGAGLDRSAPIGWVTHNGPPAFVGLIVNGRRVTPLRLNQGLAACAEDIISHRVAAVVADRHDWSVPGLKDAVSKTGRLGVEITDPPLALRWVPELQGTGSGWRSVAAPVGPEDVAMSQERKKGGLTPARMRRLEERLRSEKPLPDIAELAAYCNLSTRHLARAFREETGRPLGEYLNSVGRQRACMLLRTTKLPVRAIAERVGFSSAASFSYAFRRSTGFRPTDMRKGPRAQ
jgi:AraC-like DNA-binding protein